MKIKLQNTGFALLSRKLIVGVFVMLLFSITAYSQETQITGRVTDPDGGGLPGASILVEGTNNGTVSDADGNYSLNVPSDAKNLVFTFIGYKSKVIPINGRTSIDVNLEEDIAALEEVVVVGYGTQKRKDVTGAITGIDSEVLQERGTTSPVQALQGSVAGVQVSNSTGRIGDGFRLTIRGKGTLDDSDDANEPLYVVDGAIVDNIDFLNPQDIASIDILKDASSAAIYGSRGSNGVVIIQTKGGNSIPAGTTFSFDAFYGFKDPARLPEMMSYEKWRYYHASAYLATTDPDKLATMTPEEYYNVYASEGSNAVLRTRFENLDGFDWYDAVLKQGQQANYNLSIAHRNGKSAYTVGFGYQTETGNIDKEGLDKYSLRSSIDQQLTKKLKLGTNLTVSLNNIQRGSAVAMREAFRLNPFLSPWAIDENYDEIVGELFPLPGKLTDPVTGDFVINKTSTYNPLLEIQNSNDEQRQWNGLGNMYLNYDILEFLTFRTTFSASLESWRRGISYGAMTNTGVSNNDLPSSSVENFQNFNYSWDNQLNFKKEFGDHSFNLLALQSIFVNRTEGSAISSTDQPFETGFYGVGSGPQSTYLLDNYFIKSQLASFALRLNYDYKNKYLVTLTNRWDGSSLLSEGNKWQSFPSAAVAWRLSKEDFLQSSEVISDLKLRASYGTTGNNNVDAYSTLNILNQKTYYDFGGNTAEGWVATSLANRVLTWEKSNEVNIGLDFSLLNYKINGSIDWYNRLSDQLLVEQSLPLETGFPVINANAASVRNTGVEIMLRTTNIETDKIRWETTFTFTKNTNKIESIYGQSENDDVGNGWFIGQPIDVHYNYQFNGIWQADESDEAESYNQSEGQAKVKDINNDGKIDPDNDRVFLGSYNPDWTGGLISRLNVGNFDFVFTISSVQGVLAYSNFHANFTDTRDRGRQKLDIDWYVPENTVGVPAQASNNYPQPRNMGTFWRNDGVGYYKDASYVKVNNISLGYTLPKNSLEKLGLQQMRVYVNVLNPFVFTEYEGWDPEWAEASLNVGRVSSVTTQLGLSVKF
ncbi:SusC/RagA family TonB-linked outer membrane protein [Marinigracilibium pacificum]|uniref:SusC/RagA family TonB-linked outer membrane protein n=1 Tax=Marinigracilibium pacificum TaxID=2729599 RepID=A0A848J5A7_9BACT|nr:SusC/RagA family TonB-linked outer membrane protein [Marinigracilibium pacificum]NMM49700.1 SusC/RagA family TonB-linked outer membrane protein [Marinigracilibium pacificum]